MSAAEFSRPVPLESVGKRGAMHAIMADAAERAALARRFGLAALDRLEAEITLNWRRGSDGDELIAGGALWAEGAQACVATLEPAPFAFEADVDERFSPEAERDVPEAEAAGADDAIEPLTGDALDLGELAAQLLAVSLDPYPRAPGAPADGGRIEDVGPPPSPFARLGALKAE